MAAVRHFRFGKFIYFNGLDPEETYFAQPAKFREDRSIRWCDIAIFVIFKITAADILDFRKFKILTACPCRGQLASMNQISLK